MIELSDLTVEYDSITALQNLSLTVGSGEFVTVIGPSGGGKTTLLRAIGGLEEPTAGTVRINDQPPATLQDEAAIGFVFQEHTLLPWKTALDNVVFLRELAGKPPQREHAIELLTAMGLGEFTDAYPSALSGGMKQRVGIARAIHLGAELLLMDEPFGELDELTREDVGVELRTTWREQHADTVVFVTHSVPEAVLLGDRCIVLDGPPGTITAEVEIDLPEPRNRRTLESDAFQAHLSELRGQLFAEQ